VSEYDTGKTSISYYCAGPDNGRPVVFLHGATADHVSMANVFEPLFHRRKAAHKRIYLDFPGHGTSGVRLLRATVPDLLEDTAAFLLGNFKRPPPLVGYSMGGFLALKLAEKLRFPSLFLIAPPVRTNGSRLERPEAVTVSSDELTETERAGADARYLELAAKRTAQTLRKYKAAVGPGSSLMRRAYQTILFNTAATQDIRISHRLIKSRTTFLTGRQDIRAGYRDQFRLSSRLKDSDYHSFNDCGHFLPHECAQFGALFKHWLRHCDS